jgi:hypothetical protein
MLVIGRVRFARGPLVRYSGRHNFATIAPHLLRELGLRARQWNSRQVLAGSGCRWRLRSFSALC